MTDWQPNPEQKVWWAEYARRLAQEQAGAEPEEDLTPVIIEPANHKDDPSEWPGAMRNFRKFAEELDFHLIPFGGKYGSHDRKKVAGSFTRVYTEHEYYGLLGRREDGFLVRAVWLDGKTGDCKIREPGGIVQFVGITEMKKRMVQPWVEKSDADYAMT